MKEIKSIDDLNLITTDCDHILTLFTGSIESIYTLKLLSDSNCQVTALALDLGGGFNKEELFDIANFFDIRLKVMNCQTTFAEQAVIPAIKAQAESLHMYPVSSSLTRPIIAKVAVDLAKSLGCDAIIHSAMYSIDSMCQLGNSISLLNYHGFYGSPYDNLSLSREQMAKKLEDKGLITGLSPDLCRSSNLWCRKYLLQAPSNSDKFYVSEGVFHWSTNSISVDDQPNSISISFTNGIPTHFNHRAMKIVPLIEAVNKHIGAFGIGRFSSYDYSDNTTQQIEICEAPAAIAIMMAYRHLETSLLGNEVMLKKSTIEKSWITETNEGRWFGVLKGALESFINYAANNITGTVSFTLQGGALNVTAIECNNAVMAE